MRERCLERKRTGYSSEVYLGTSLNASLRMHLTVTEKLLSVRYLSFSYLFVSVWLRKWSNKQLGARILFVYFWLWIFKMLRKKLQFFLFTTITVFFSFKIFMYFKFVKYISSCNCRISFMLISSINFMNCSFSFDLLDIILWDAVHCSI